VDQRACVNLPAWPLQILFRSHPDWQNQPAVVVDRDKPQGVILWSNERARKFRILPGMRYAAGLALERELRAGVVPDNQITREVNRLTRRLGNFTSGVEPCPREPGIFWLNANGLSHLFPSFEAWATAIRQDLNQAGFRAFVSVGFTRFGSYAAAKASTRNIIFQNAEQEQNYLRAVAIEHLGFTPSLRDKLAKLGITTVGGFMDLPAAGIRRRFGVDAQELHRQAVGEGWSPVKAKIILEPVRETALFEYAETNFDRLETNLQPMVRAILSKFSERREAVSKLRFSLTLDDGSIRDEQLSPATPTRDEKQLLALLRLRIESLSFTSGVVEMKIQGAGVPESQQQPELFRQSASRNLEEAHRAFARICAELGNDAVVYARLTEGHLPEGCFEWKPFTHLSSPDPAQTTEPPLVRRIYSSPVALPARSRPEPDGWLITGGADGPVEEVIGPHVISGGWWRREIDRAYYYVRTRSGRWLWIYRDQQRKRWHLQGEVE